MSRLKLSALVFALACALPPTLAAAEPPQDPSSLRSELISKPDWVRTPGLTEAMRKYPERAMHDGVSGMAEVQCTVRSDGSLTDCELLGESPAGVGFGEGALKLSSKYLLRRPSASQPPIAGRQVRYVLYWTMERHPVAPRSYRVGVGAVLITPLKDADPVKGSIACATTKSPDQRCGLHQIQWLVSPSLEESAPAILATNQTTGLSQLSCGVGPDGELSSCKPAGQVSDAATAAMIGFVPGLKAPPAAMDGTPLSEGVIVIIFDWARLSQAARVVSRVR
ncbi:MAG: TonB family protein [Caulobacter sp.]|nr:TonB family protein [Caulobacter sp.]